jgi:SAM-dependent methyltransferase
MSTVTAQPEAAPHPIHSMMPRVETEAELRALRSMFDKAGFDSDGICRRLEIASIHEFTSKCNGRHIATAIERPIDALIRLFLDGEFLDERLLDTHLGSGAAATLQALRIAARHKDYPGQLFATITIYPTEGSFLLAGDRLDTPDGSQCWMPPDVVYPGILENTGHFIEMLPRTPCDALLDLGTGSGVATFAMAKYARQVWGSDIAARSVRFAEFSRQINGIENVTIVEGDLYDAVTGLTFDRIITHPPYVPAVQTEFIFRDGGDDGEQILRRVVEGLPQYLRPGGRFYTLVLGADLEDETFEARIRRWLGAHESAFDVVMVSHSLRTPSEFVANSLRGGKVKLRDLKFWTDTWARRKAQFLFYGAVLIRHHEKARAPFTARVQRGNGFQPAHLDWLLDWEAECREPGATDFLFGLRPAIASNAQLHVLHRLHEGSFTPELYGIEINEPFVTDLRCAKWTVALIASCDGRRTWREVLEDSRKAGLVADEVPNDEFADLLRALVGQGLLRVAERPL